MLRLETVASWVVVRWRGWIRMAVKLSHILREEPPHGGVSAAIRHYDETFTAGLGNYTGVAKHAYVVMR